MPACFAAQRLGVLLRPEPHGGELEELAAEQVAVDQEEGGDVDARHQKQHQRQQVAGDHDAEEFSDSTIERSVGTGVPGGSLG